MTADFALEKTGSPCDQKTGSPRDQKTGSPYFSRRPGLLVLIPLLVGGIACTDRLPDQDLRIVAAVPIERLSASVLWDDYQKDAAAADRRYRGQAIVISGPPPELGSGEPGQRFVRFLVPDKKGAVRANLLDEQAAAILTAAKGAERVVLKCFCEGLAGDVILKSCVAP